MNSECCPVALLVCLFAIGALAQHQSLQQQQQHGGDRQVRLEDIERDNLSGGNGRKVGYGGQQQYTGAQQQQYLSAQQYTGNQQQYGSAGAGVGGQTLQSGGGVQQLQYGGAQLSQPSTGGVNLLPTSQPSLQLMIIPQLDTSALGNFFYPTPHQSFLFPHTPYILPQQPYQLSLPHQAVLLPQQQLLLGTRFTQPSVSVDKSQSQLLSGAYKGSQQLLTGGTRPIYSQQQQGPPFNYQSQSSYNPYNTIYQGQQQQTKFATGVKSTVSPPLKDSQPSQISSYNNYKSVF